ncbi:hypothetical protein NP493_969g00011 [Ridgeia piscesae]|uniref:Uncharacterized protein n=1 Tax=Ridgeia piscesae TaxID=27915 RepID=A0AAD9KJ61_RIDPI|nr:hypothetical protein NP493_969g00011 [Ridgeia piscesae]
MENASEDFCHIESPVVTVLLVENLTLHLSQIKFTRFAKVIELRNTDLIYYNAACQYVWQRPFISAARA